jgi:hypothetical protein
MRTSWRSLIAMLLAAEFMLAAWVVKIQPRCEPCYPGEPCPPCISDDQRMLMMIAGLLPVAVVLGQMIVTYRIRRAP